MKERSSRINTVLFSLVILTVIWAGYFLYTFITLDDKVVRNLSVAGGISALVIITAGLKMWRRQEKGPNVAIIPVQGELVTYLGAETRQGRVASEDIMFLIREAEADPDVKVHLFLIDVPTGSLAAAEEIVSTLKQIEKPSVAMIRGEAAAAGYYAASGADVIFAVKNSRIGSLAITTTNKSNKNLENEWQDDLVVTVAANRSLDIDKVRELARGSVMSGEAALREGLIDKIGGAEKLEEFLSNKIKEKVNLEW